MVKRTLLISLGILILSFSVFSQTSKLDSLNTLLEDAKGPYKGHLLIEIANISPKDDAITQYRRVIEEFSDSVVLARAIYNLGACLFNQRRFQEAEDLVEANLPLFENNKAAAYYVEGMYSTYAKIQMFKGNYSLAFKNFYRCMALLRPREDSLMLGSLFIDIGLLHYKVGNNLKALEFYSRGMNLLRHEKSIQFLGNMNSSLCLSELGFPSLALSYCDRAFALADSEEMNLLYGEFATGSAQLKLGRLEEAREMFKCSLERSVALNHIRMQADNLLYLGKTWISESMLDSAYQTLVRAEDLALQNELKETLLDTYRGIIQIAYKRNELDQLTAYQRKYIQLKGDVYNMELEQAQASFHGDFYEYENRQFINFQKQELDEHENAMVYQQLISVALYVVFLLVIIIIGLYLRSLYFHRKSQAFLEGQVHSRDSRLKSPVILNSYENEDGCGQEVLELSDMLHQCRLSLINIAKKAPQLLLEDSFGEYIARIEKDSFETLKDSSHSVVNYSNE